MSIALDIEPEMPSFPVQESSTSPVHRFSGDDYHRMIETGVLGKYDRVVLTALVFWRWVR
jgi:hypothetical protein